MVKNHAEYAASSSKRWRRCLPSVILSKRAPPEVERKAASEGTKAHELMELALTSGESSFDIKGDFTPEMRAHVDNLVEFIAGLHAEMPGAKLLVEKKVYLDALHPFEAFGTVDIALVEPFGVLHVIDFKYGFEWVDHRDNDQMIYYALGIAYEEGFDFECVKTTIYQPRCGDGKPRTDTFSVDKLYRYELLFKEPIEMIESGEVTESSHLVAGDHCRWCPAKIICPEITKSALQQAQLDFERASQPSPTTLSPTQLGAILDKAAYLRLWIKEVEDRAKLLLENKKRVPGWELVPTRAARKWARPEEMIAMGDPLFKRRELVSPCKAIQFMKKKGWTSEQIANFEEENFVSVSGGTKLQSTTNYDALLPEIGDINYKDN